MKTRALERAERIVRRFRPQRLRPPSAADRDALDAMAGPFVIIGRGHSGSRLLSEAFAVNGVWMGDITNSQRDTAELKQQIPLVRYLVQEGYRYDESDSAARATTQRLAGELVDRVRSTCPDPQARPGFGWKRAIGTFAIQPLLDACPEGKTIHLVRDGRDVMLSRLDFRIRNLDDDPLHRLVVFGDPSVSSYRGQPLSAEVIERYRNELEMHHWVTAVSFARRARAFGPERYFELRYEDLCTRPTDALAQVFAFLGIPFREETKRWIDANASARSIGKFRGREHELADAIEIGRPMLEELGYSS